MLAENLIAGSAMSSTTGHRGTYLECYEQLYIQLAGLRGPIDQPHDEVHDLYLNRRKKTFIREAVHLPKWPTVSREPGTSTTKPVRGDNSKSHLVKASLALLLHRAPEEWRSFSRSRDEDVRNSHAVCQRPWQSRCAVAVPVRVDERWKGFAA